MLWPEGHRPRGPMGARPGKHHRAVGGAVPGAARLDKERDGVEARRNGTALYRESHSAYREGPGRPGIHGGALAEQSGAGCLGDLQSHNCDPISGSRDRYAIPRTESAHLTERNIRWRDFNHLAILK